MTTLVNDSGQEIIIEDVPLTKQAASFFDAKIKGNYSLNFDIPATSENKSKIGYYGPQQVGALLKQTWTITRNGNRLSRGQLVIQAIGDEIELFFISGNAEWISELIKSTADFEYEGTPDDDLSIIWNNGSIASALSNTSGIIFPLVDWGYKGNRAGTSWSTGYNYATDTATVFTDFYPCIYLHTVVKKILRQSGFKAAGSLLDNADFNRIVICPGRKLETPANFIEERKVIARASAPITFASVLVDYQISVNTLIKGSSSIHSVTSYSYTANENMSVQCRVSGVATFTSALGEVVINAFVNGVFRTIIGFTFNTDASGTVVTALFPVDDIYGVINLNRGDVLTYYATVVTTTSVSVSNFQVETYPIKNPIIGNWVRASDWVKLKSIDVIKFILTYFGCSASYDNQSKTVSFNIIENITTQEDWSAYIQSYKAETEETQSQNNLFVWADTDQFSEYAQLFDGGFGGGNLTTDIKQDKEDPWYEAPFAPVQSVRTGLGKNRGNWLLPRIDLFSLSDNGGKDFTSISNAAGGLCQFNGSGFEFIADEIVRVTDGVGYSNYGVVKSATATTVILYAVTYSDFPFSSGSIIKQSGNYNNTPPRLMYCLPNQVLADFGYGTAYSSVSGGTESATTQIAYGWFQKQDINDTVDNLRQSMAIENQLNGLSHKDTYLKKVGKILGNPVIKAQMLLPESVFSSYNFDKFIYIKFKELSGRFFPKAIEEYRDGRTVVRVDLFQID